MKYNGYSASIEYDADDRIFHGRVEEIEDMVTFEGTTVDELEAGFKRSVDEYLAFCEAQGMEPLKPYSGRLLLRLSPAMHRDATRAAARRKESLNAWLVKAVRARLDAPPPRRANPRASAGAGR